MSKAVKIWLIIAASLVLLGGMIFVGAMSMLNWNFGMMSTNKYQTNVNKTEGDISSILINTDTADISFVVSEDRNGEVECYETEKTRHSVTLVDGALSIKLVDTRKWYEHIGIGFEAPKITVYISEGEYGALAVNSKTGKLDIPEGFCFASIKVSESTGSVNLRSSVSGEVEIDTTTGNITVENISAGSLDLEVSTGKVNVSGVSCAGDISVEVETGKAHLNNVTCKTLSSEGDTGDITLTQVIASERFSIERSTGDVTFESSDAAEIYVETDTGDVSGILLTDKVFLVKSDTGKVSVPNTVEGGRCEINTDTGDVKISVAQ